MYRKIVSYSSRTFEFAENWMLPNTLHWHLRTWNGVSEVLISLISIPLGIVTFNESPFSIIDLSIIFLF